MAKPRTPQIGVNPGFLTLYGSIVGFDAWNVFVWTFEDFLFFFLENSVIPIDIEQTKFLLIYIVYMDHVGAYGPILVL